MMVALHSITALSADHTSEENVQPVTPRALSEAIPRRQHAGRTNVWPDHMDPCGPPGSDGTLSAGAPRAGRCFPAVLGRLHPNLGAKMENAPNPKQAASRHQLGQFQPHGALRGGRPVVMTGPTRAGTNRSLTRKWWFIRVTQRC